MKLEPNTVTHRNDFIEIKVHPSIIDSEYKLDKYPAEDLLFYGFVNIVRYLNLCDVGDMRLVELATKSYNSIFNYITIPVNSIKNVSVNKVNNEDYKKIMDSICFEFTTVDMYVQYKLIYNIDLDSSKFSIELYKLDQEGSKKLAYATDNFIFKSDITTISMPAIELDL